MSLTPEEKARYKHLMEKIQKYGTDSLTRDELKELKYLIEKKEDLDESLKLLILFALGVLVGYSLAKGK